MLIYRILKVILFQNTEEKIKHLVYIFSRRINTKRTDEESTNKSFLKTEGSISIEVEINSVKRRFAVYSDGNNALRFHVKRNI